MHNDGSEYEQFVADLQQAILDTEAITTQKTILIEKNKVIEDNFGIPREFDLYWEYELAGISYKTVIECKDYNSAISVEKIDALLGKIKDIPDLKPVFATKKGYQSGAIKKAEANRVDLLIVREQNDSDWQDKDGNPYIKTVVINIQIHVPARITNFEPNIDGDWLISNTNIDPSEPFQIFAPEDQIYIENLDTGRTQSLHEIIQEIDSIPNHEYGSFVKEEELSNAFLVFDQKKLKLLSYKLSYTVNRPHVHPLTIDFSKELKGVVEYLQKGTKKTIFREGPVRDEPI